MGSEGSGEGRRWECMQGGVCYVTRGGEEGTRKVFEAADLCCAVLLGGFVAGGFCDVAQWPWQGCCGGC